jgi:hypothetical protein
MGGRSAGGGAGQIRRNRPLGAALRAGNHSDSLGMVLGWCKSGLAPVRWWASAIFALGVQNTRNIGLTSLYAARNPGCRQEVTFHLAHDDAGVGAGSAGRHQPPTFSASIFDAPDRQAARSRTHHPHQRPADPIVLLCRRARRRRMRLMEIADDVTGPVNIGNPAECQAPSTACGQKLFRNAGTGQMRRTAHV